MKKIIGFLLTLSVSIGILLFSADSVIAASYNSSAALNYAAAHWNDNVGLCAEFVSNCLSAGGCSAWSRSSSALRNQLINSGLGTEYELILNSDKSITASNYSGKLTAGDVIFYYCPGAKCSARPYVHTVLCNGADANGYVKVYAHNKANSGSKKYYYSKTCPNCGTGIYKAYVYHFKTNETPANIGTNVYGTIINTACWKPITYNPADGLVRLNQGNGMANQAWKFFRQSDGSYVIKSAVDQKALEIFNGDTADGTPLVVRNTDWGGAYQRWYLYPYGNNGGYIIKSKHYPEKNLVLDLCGGSTVDNNIIQIHERNNTNAQIFSVYTAPDCKIIFVSINPEYFQDVYYVDHLQFLVKPIERKRLDFALGKVAALCEKEYVCLKIRGAIQKILAESILYFEVSGHTTTIHLNDETEQLCYITLKEIERRLNQTIFLRCHRSFIVNMKHVSRYERSSLQLDDKHMVSIGKKYEKDVRQKLMSYWKDVI